jgi:catechol-2,3-dioxygenase
MAVKELGHVVLYVHNLERSAAFYGDVLGFERIDAPLPGMPAAAFVSQSHRTHHELLLIEVGEDAQEIPRGRRVGMYHIGLKVGDSDDELRAVLAELQAGDVTIVGASDHHVSHSLYIQDPDGNEIELYVDVPEVDWRNDPTAVLAPIRPLRL